MYNYIAEDMYITFIQTHHTYRAFVFLQIFSKCVCVCAGESACTRARVYVAVNVPLLVWYVASHVCPIGFSALLPADVDAVYIMRAIVMPKGHLFSIEILRDFSTIIDSRSENMSTHILFEACRILRQALL